MSLAPQQAADDSAPGGARLPPLKAVRRLRPAAPDGGNQTSAGRDGGFLFWQQVATWSPSDFWGLECGINATRQLSEGQWRLTVLNRPSNNEPLLYCQLLQCDSRTTEGAVTHWLTVTIGASSGVQICVDSAPVAPEAVPRDLTLNSPYQLGLYLQQVERTFARCPGAWGREQPPHGQTNDTEVQTLGENHELDSLAPCERREGRYYYRSRKCLRWRTAKANTCAECRNVQLTLRNRESRSLSSDELQPKPRRRPEYLLLCPRVLLSLYLEKVKQVRTAAAAAGNHDDNHDDNHDEGNDDNDDDEGSHSNVPTSEP